MTTSGDTAFSLTARDHIYTALQESAIIPLGDDPEAEELTACLRRFNGMLKTWQARGVLWKQETIDQVITADTATATLPAYVRGVNAVRYVESATNERQMRRFERDEYKKLPNKAASGVSTLYYVDRAVDALVISVWPVPTANATLRLDIDRKMDTITNASETVDIPEEWAETVYLNLAVRCADIFGAELKPRLVAMAQSTERELFDNYRPASYFLGPDV